MTGLDYAFYNTPCASTSCGVVQMDNCPITGYVMDDSSIRTAVTAWTSNAATAEATYGHISTWETSGVTDMSDLFSWTSFNEDIGAWDTSGVTSMVRLFQDAPSFNQDIGGWSVGAVIDMEYMFEEASAFDQDLGWCVDDDVILTDAFLNAPCASTSCGVTQGSCTQRNF